MSYLYSKLPETGVSPHIGTGGVEEAIVAGFIKGLYNTNYAEFEKLLQIFMGVLIEEFISTVTEIGSIPFSSELKVFYDTGLLLRVLGCSGDLLRVATEELTRYLQDLGCGVFYFSGNETEVSNILDTIIYVKDSGGELEGETAAALSDGEVSITDVRMLRNSFPEQLAQRNIFPAGEMDHGAAKLSKYQIDEVGFREYLLREANKSKRAYGVQNRINDASYLAGIIRLRQGVRTRDFTECRFLFVTPNNFLAKTARRFLIEQKVLSGQQCPAVLSVGQVATIAWLMKDKALEPKKAGRELLTSCFAAIRPDAEWFGYFREGMEKVVGSLDDFVRDPHNSLSLQSARRIAQEESFGSGSLVRELNLAEIMSRAKVESEALIAEKALIIEAAQKRIEIERQRTSEIIQGKEIEFAKAAEEAKKGAEAEKELAVISAGNLARAEFRAQIEELNRKRAFGWADIIVATAKIIFAVLFVAFGTMLYLLRHEAQESVWLLPLTVFFGFISLLEFLHLLGVPVVEKPFALLRDNIGSRLARLFSS